MANSASKSVKFLYQKLGNDNFIKFIDFLINEEGVLDKKLAENLTKPFQKPVKSKGSSQDFKRFLREKRKKMSTSKDQVCNNLGNSDEVPVLICQKDKNKGSGSEILEEEDIGGFDINPNLQNSQNPTFKKLFEEN